MTPAFDQRLNALRPGHEIRLAGDARCWTTAERSGDGPWLRFVRHTPTGFEVFKTVRF